MKKTLNRAVFLDRDGVINKKAPEHDYVKNWSEFEFMPSIAEVIKKLNKNFLVIAISNQRGVARGLMSKNDVENIHDRMKAELSKSNAKIDAIYFCPHDIEDNCSCRKPKPGMIAKAAEELNIDVTGSYMVGDGSADIKAGESAGCKTIFLGSSDLAKEWGIKPYFLIKNISEIIKIIK